MSDGGSSAGGANGYIARTRGTSLDHLGELRATRPGASRSVGAPAPAV